jgi:adenylate cyclase
MDAMQLPDSLQSLILSRIDTLTVEQQTTLKVASIIGRVFPVAWLWRVHPGLGPVAQVRADLRALAALDLTPLDTPEPEPRYLFKHIITQEVTYASLPFALRARLHEQLAAWLESSADAADPPLDLLAYHFGRSANTAKQREYYRKAGDAAAARFANAAAVQYYENLAVLLPPAEQGPVHVLLGDMQERLSAWDAAETHYRAALTLAGGAANAVHRAQASLGLGAVERARGAYSAAVAWLEQARREFAALERRDGLSLVLIHLAIVYWVQGKLDQTQALVDEILALEGTTGDKWRISRALHLLGNVALSRGDYPLARQWWVRSLALKRELGDKPGIAGSVTNMALAAFNEGQYTEARTLVTESLALYQELGSRREYGQARGVLARIHLAEEDLTTARSLFAANLILFRDLGARQEIVVALIGLAAATGPAASRYAVRLIAAAMALLAAIDSAIEPGDQMRADAVVADAHARLGADGVREAWAQGQAMAWQDAVAYALAPGAG